MRLFGPPPARPFQPASGGVYRPGDCPPLFDVHRNDPEAVDGWRDLPEPVKDRIRLRDEIRHPVMTPRSYYGCVLDCLRENIAAVTRCARRQWDQAHMKAGPALAGSSRLAISERISGIDQTPLRARAGRRGVPDSLCPVCRRRCSADSLERNVAAAMTRLICLCQPCQERASQSSRPRSSRSKALTLRTREQACEPDARGPENTFQPLTYEMNWRRGWDSYSCSKM